jgi:hypothetical protein
MVNSTMKSPSAGQGFTTTNGGGNGELDEHDYSLSVSELNSLYNTSGGKGLGMDRGTGLMNSENDSLAPRFKY